MRCLLLFSLVLAFEAQAQRVAHVVVALCDNVHQGIVKVPASLGNGQSTSANLYWGAAFGVRTFFDHSKEWIRLQTPKPAEAHILERVLWKHRDSAVYLVADAYDGRNIREATEDLLTYASGAKASKLNVAGALVPIGGGADLVAYAGHDGLMDFTLEGVYPARDQRKRQAIILACVSKGYYADHLKSTGATPLVWTTGLMAPEAYTLHAALAGWVLRESDAAIRERAAQAYHRYQKCGLNAARRLLVTGW
ncbi:MAG: hypothetical protein KA175_12060 [Flavobacteriales bacterium]|nr:hypothetical protein [Flavobacteriales bacterium]MBP6698347.1 hypothetical protein [Flavobacteriales bacterium]